MILAKVRPYNADNDDDIVDDVEVDDTDYHDDVDVALPRGPILFVLMCSLFLKVSALILANVIWDI